MDQFKTPTSLLTIANTAAILGIGVYYYQQINALQVEVRKYTAMTDSCIGKTNEILAKLNNINGLVEALKKLDASIVKIQRSIKAIELRTHNNELAYSKLVDMLIGNGTIDKKPRVSFRKAESDTERFEGEAEDEDEDDVKANVSDHAEALRKRRASRK